MKGTRMMGFLIMQRVKKAFPFLRQHIGIHRIQTILVVHPEIMRC
ncbi:hypothetical protein LINGRAHAP2_LOCUS10628 [Linum grandiflorum]